ncbi:MAG: DUF2891 domain-containing protein [Brevundimonas sp.]|jgi:hypothetical protein|nr:DUF2891 domain-containing protein [Brevundimonas sp.]MCZ8322575.1 DUF2891 domain-containing protein [Novosphingobium sp.]
MTKLTADHAARFMVLTTGHLTREFPHKLDHVLDGPEDARTPRDLHPIFFGSFDWHSCVHGWWQVLRLARLYPDLPEAERVWALADEMLTAENFAIETAYLARPSARGFERPYGWAWALALHAEMVRHDRRWAGHADAFAAAFACRFRDFLPIQTYPIRVGTHYSSAFALTLARDWALAHDPALASLIDAKARDWFVNDVDCQAWEPGGDEFLSSALTEALLMTRVLGEDFGAWFDRFLPRAAHGQPATLFNPATVSDRSDGKIAHLDGLNLSRAWCWRGIAAALPADHAVCGPALTTAKTHLDTALPHLGDDYMGEHWLATFAVLALEA